MRRNGILKNGILIMAGALALGACGGRQDRQQTTAQPESTEPARRNPDEGQDTARQGMAGTPAPGQDTAGQDMTGTPAPGQDTTQQGMPSQEPGQAMPGHDMPGQSVQGQQGTSGPCPTDVQGTVASTEENPEGMAIAFTTTGDVAAVRVRVQRLADLHNEQHARRMQAMAQDQAGVQAETGAQGKKAAREKKGKKAGKTKAGKQGETAQAEPSGMAGEPPDVILMTVARAEEMPGGARLVLTVIEPATIESAREPLRTHAQTMASAQCHSMLDSMSEMQHQGASPGTTGTTSQPAGQGTPGQPRTTP